MNAIFDELVQLLSPFGWEVRMTHDGPHGPPHRLIMFNFRLRVRAEASKLKDQILGYKYGMDEYQIHSMRDASFLAQRIARQVILETMDRIQYAAYTADTPVVVGGQS